MDLDKWLTKMEVRERTGMSERTIERKIQSKEIRREYRNVPGRKPLAILHPEDVAKFEARTMKPVYGDTAKPSPKAVLTSTVPSQNMAAFMTALLNKPEDKLYLSLKESARFSGLPMSYLRRKVQEGAIPAVKLAGWKIKRKDLERYDAATGGMMA